MFQDFDFAGGFSKSTSGGTLCVFGSHTFVQQVGCVRNKLHYHTVQTESEIISLDAGLRLDGILLLTYGI